MHGNVHVFSGVLFVWINEVRIIEVVLYLHRALCFWVEVMTLLIIHVLKLSPWKWYSTCLCMIPHYSLRVDWQ